jgi:hypothetical protein
VDQQSRNHKVLKISLDLSVPVDSEVHQILMGFSSGMERKNYLLSAVLYYARSPLVITANALVDRLSGFKDGEFSEVRCKLDEILEAIRSVQLAPVSVARGQAEQSAAEKKPAGSLDEEAKLTLLSLKQKFKV